MCQYKAGGVCSSSGVPCTMQTDSNRCQMSAVRTKSKSNSSSLLLAPQDAEADELLRRTLLAAGCSFARLGSLLIVGDAQRRMTELSASLLENLPEDIRAGIRAAYAPADVNSYEQALFSFAAAEPLEQLLGKATENRAVVHRVSAV